MLWLGTAGGRSQTRAVKSYCVTRCTLLYFPTGSLITSFTRFTHTVRHSLMHALVFVSLLRTHCDDKHCIALLTLASHQQVNTKCKTHLNMLVVVIVNVEIILTVKN